VIYLDNAATTPLHPKALEVMLPFLTGGYGNPSATYSLARQAQKAIDDARKTTASILNCRPSDIIFTSGGTESINAALRGVAFAQQKARAGNHIVTSQIEHTAVLNTTNQLEQFGFDVTYVPAGRDGIVDAEAVAAAVNERTTLVSLMLANNEVGTLQPVAEAAKLVAARARSMRKRIPFHTDAVQAPGLLSLDVEALGIDLLSLSGHKFGGPKGSGVLYLRRGIPFVSQMTGGGQERQRRAGTENVAATAGLAAALSIADSERDRKTEACLRLRDHLIEGLLDAVPDIRLNGDREQRLANNVSVSIRGVRGDHLVLALDRAGVAASAGAACGMSSWEPSHVLLAMGLSMPDAVGGLRLTLSADTTEAELDEVIRVLPGIVARLRAGGR
jgi:cysteine desulfurase